MITPRFLNFDCNVQKTIIRQSEDVIALCMPLNGIKCIPLLILVLSTLASVLCDSKKFWFHVALSISSVPWLCFVVSISGEQGWQMEVHQRKTRPRSVALVDECQSMIL